jgi:serine/threonine protein phosphatase PrpC
MVLIYSLTYSRDHLLTYLHLLLLYLAIFDGHGGSGASEYCKEHLLKYVVQDPNYNKHIPTALYNSFCKVDDEFTSIARIRYLNDGTIYSFTHLLFTCLTPYLRYYCSCSSDT